MSEQRETIAFDFQTNGIREVAQAFQTVEQIMLRAERNSVAITSREALRRLEIARDGARKRVREEQGAVDQIAGAEAQLRDKAGRFAEARLEIAKRTAQKRKDTELALVKDLERIAEDHARRQGQIDERAHAKMLERRRQFRQAVAGAAVGSVHSMAATAASWGGMALTLGGGLSVTAAAQRAMSAESAAGSLANSMFLGSSSTSEDAVEQRAWLAKHGKNGRFDPAQIMALAGKAQAVSGFDKASLAAGWQDYVGKSADWKAIATKEGQGTLIELAKLAKATGSDIGQVMSAAGSLRVQNQQLGPAEMMGLMRSIVGQGKMGAVEMKDLASVASTVTASSGSYAMNQEHAQRALLGLSQIAIQTSSSPAEAATAVARFSTDVQGHAKQMKALGIDPIADKKTGALKSPSEILAQIFEKTGGNSSKFGEGKGNVGLGRESVRIANALMPVFRQGVEEAKARGVRDEKQLSRAGADAVRKNVQKFEAAGYDQKDIDRDLANKMAESQERFNKVTNELTESLETRVKPFIGKLADALEKGSPKIEHFMDALFKVATWLVDNPWKGIGLAVAGKLTTDIGSAMIGELVKRKIESVIEHGLSGGAGGVGGGGKLGTLGKAGLIAGTAVAAGELGALGIDALWKAKTDDDNAALGNSVSAFADAKALQRDAVEGKLTPEKEQRLLALRETMARQVQQDKANQYEISWGEAIGKTLTLGGLIGEGDESKRFQAERDARLKRSQEAFDELNKAVLLASGKMRELAGGGVPDPNHPSRREPIQFSRGT